ncbi:hypothetical protein GCM10010507_10910 [Streptomyces cinnamoneus]|uniref:Uncharacterized protein n=1 Tax=Streptomyces cinnamoneus TaxID=53446 RepID=A0A918WEJ1_STRCJ|nr:hypothetical protein GCM10010507_10910 [Streptomyces cinnamoneus]
MKELPRHVIDAPWPLLPLSYRQVSQENEDVAVLPEAEAEEAEAGAATLTAAPPARARDTLTAATR